MARASPNEAGRQRFNSSRGTRTTHSSSAVIEIFILKRKRNERVAEHKLEPIHIPNHGGKNKL